MKKLLLLACLLSMIECRKKPTEPAVPTDPSTGLPINAYEFNITNLPDTNLIIINGKEAEIKKFGNIPTYIINKGDIVNVYISYKPDKTKIGPRPLKGQNKDSLILYYTQYPDTNFYTCHDAFSLFKERNPASEKNLFPKYRLIINGKDTLFKRFIKGTLTY